MHSKSLLPHGLRPAGVAALAAACALGAPAAFAAASRTENPAHRPTTAPRAAATTAKSYESRSDQVWLAFDQTAAERFVNTVSVAGTDARRFLSPAAYTQRFGPSAARITAVTTALRHKGFTQIRVSVNHDYVSAIPSARDKGLLSFSGAVAGDVAGVTGINGPRVRGAAGRDTAGSPATAHAPDAITGPGSKGDCSAYWGQKTEVFSPAYDGLTRAVVPVCGYSAGQIRSAYELTAADTGHGRTIALIEVGTPDQMPRALHRWARANGLRAPSSGQFREVKVGGGGSDRSCLNAALEEEALDTEAAYAMSPDAKLVMYDGDTCDTAQAGAQGLYDAMLAPLTGPGSHPAASVESVSYGVTSAEMGTPRALLTVSNLIALRAAAEGVSLLLASGDSPGLEPPDADPYVTAVGGTTLAIGAGGRRLFETGWSSDFAERVGTAGAWTDTGIAGGSSGGVSRDYAEPAYQKGVVPASMLGAHPGRVVPDIAADGDPYSGMLFGAIAGGRYGTFRQAGTSLAAPLVAGIIADAEQGRSAPYGFLNPRLYALAGTSAFYDTRPVSAQPTVDRAYYTAGETSIRGHFTPGFFVAPIDAQNRRGTRQVTAGGFDTMTGLGSPDGSALIHDLQAGR